MLASNKRLKQAMYIKSLAHSPRGTPSPAMLRLRVAKLKNKKVKIKIIESSAMGGLHNFEIWYLNFEFSAPQKRSTVRAMILCR